MITIKFVCGHAASFADTIASTPPCPTCGEYKIRRVDAPPPVFRGASSGPCAQPTHLEPLIVPVIERKKENSHA